MRVRDIYLGYPLVVVVVVGYPVSATHTCEVGDLEHDIADDFSEPRLEICRQLRRC